MKVYIAGPMRGYDNYNFDAFDAAAARLKEQGHYPVSPANIDRVFEGWGKYPPKDFVPTEADYVSFMDRDLNAIRGCDAIYMLSQWQESKGANVEYAYADFLGKAIMYQEYDYE